METYARRILWQRVNDFLGRYQPHIISITGSSAKTLTAEAIRLALGNQRLLRVSPPSSNAPLGVACAILGIDRPTTSVNWVKLLAKSLVREVATEEPDTIILEIGAHRPGDIDWVAQHLNTHIAVVTNVGSKSLNYFASKELVAHEHASLVATLAREAFAVLNADDPLVADMGEHTQTHVVLYGHADEATVRLVRLNRLPHHGFACEITVAGRSYELHLPNIINRHHVYSALAALAVVHAMQLDVHQAVRQLTNLLPPAGVMRLLDGRNNSLLLDDSYAATPEDMLAALESLRSLPATRRIAILGDVVDLGGESLTWHKKIGKFAGEVASVVVAVGEEMRDGGAEAMLVGADVHHFNDSDEVGKWLADFLRSGDVVLIKGSREMQMEHSVARLLANPEQDTAKLVQL